MSLDIKVTYLGSVRRFKAPFAQRPSHSSLLEQSLSRHGLKATELYELAFDNAGEEVLLCDDDDVQAIWPTGSPSDSISLAEYIDSLPPLRLTIRRKADVPSSETPIPAEQSTADGQRENSTTAPEEAADDPPDFDLPNLDEESSERDSPIMTVTRGIVGILQGHIERLPVDENIRTTSVGILSSVTSIGSAVDQLARTGQDVFRAVLTERAQRMAREADTPAAAQGMPASSSLGTASSSQETAANSQGTAPSNQETGTSTDDDRVKQAMAGTERIYEFDELDPMSYIPPEREPLWSRLWKADELRAASGRALGAGQTRYEKAVDRAVMARQKHFHWGMQLDPPELEDALREFNEADLDEHYAKLALSGKGLDRKSRQSTTGKQRAANVPSGYSSWAQVETDIFDDIDPEEHQLKQALQGLNPMMLGYSNQWKGISNKNTAKRTFADLLNEYIGMQALAADFGFGESTDIERREELLCHTKDVQSLQAQLLSRIQRFKNEKERFLDQPDESVAIVYSAVLQMHEDVNGITALLAQGEEVVCDERNVSVQETSDNLPCGTEAATQAVTQGAIGSGSLLVSPPASQQGAQSGWEAMMGDKVAAHRAILDDARRQTAELLFPDPRPCDLHLKKVLECMQERQAYHRWFDTPKKAGRELFDQMVNHYRRVCDLTSLYKKDSALPPHLLAAPGMREALDQKLQQRQEAVIQFYMAKRQFCELPSTTFSSIVNDAQRVALSCPSLI